MDSPIAASLLRFLGILTVETESRVQEASRPSPTGSDESSGCWSLGSIQSNAADSGVTEEDIQLAERGHGRDILDLYSNVTNGNWSYQPSILPKRNPRMFLDNRSVYHRNEGHFSVVSGVVNCECCGFPVPVIL